MNIRITASVSSPPSQRVARLDEFQKSIVSAGELSVLEI